MAHPMDNLERMEDAWDRMSGDYAERLGLDPRDEHYRMLGEQFPVTLEPVQVLDLGCGLGFELDAVLPRAPKARIVCMDMSRKMLARLRERLAAFATQIDTRHESYVDAEFGCAQFDFVLSALTVHHLPRPTKLALFRKICRALRPGGAYLELDDMASPDRERVGREWYEEFVAHREGGERGEWNHNMTFTIENEKALLEEAGFSSVTVPWTQTYADGCGRAIFVAEKAVEPER